MPTVCRATTVVETGDVKINEFFGHASNNGGTISIAHVTWKGEGAEDWQTPDFDEYVLILRGVVHIQHEAGVTVVGAGESVFLKKGERVKWVFPSKDGVEYIPICLPAFTPDNVHREEEPAAEQGHPSKKYPYLYHLIQKPLWESTRASGQPYLPPTHADDGFTHATANEAALITVANHFYTDVPGEWVCLQMTAETLGKDGLTVKWENPSPVGTKPPLNSEQSQGEVFPHIYGGGLTPASVLKEYKVNRTAEGIFLGIEGLVE